MNDAEAWNLYPQHRKWFNKLYLANKLKYKCGPSGISPSETNEYIVRPIYNLSGMGIGAKVIHIDANDTTKVPPGYFWCEYFNGSHYSITYKWIRNSWNIIESYEGFNLKEELTKFKKWIKVDIQIQPHKIFDDLRDVEYINIEYKGDNPIEVHLRGSDDPKYSELIPIWLSNVNDIDILLKQGYTFIESIDSGDGFLDDPRVGFMVKE